MSPPYWGCWTGHGAKGSARVPFLGSLNKQGQVLSPCPCDQVTTLKLRDVERLSRESQTAK